MQFEGWVIRAEMSAGFAARTAFLGERPSLRNWGGIGLVTAGVLALAWKR